MLDEEPQGGLLQLLRLLHARLDYERASGTRWIARRTGRAGDAVRAAPPAIKPLEPPAIKPLEPPAIKPLEPPAIKLASAPAPAGGSAALNGVNVASLDELRAHIGDCQRCKLAGGRTKLVFGVGNPNADLMFVGEGPGRDEDLRGEPFVGRAGQLLTEIITNGMKLGRDDVYIANVVKCRPPENRNPEPDEITTCLPFLERQIELVRPRVIVALGKFAAHTLLGVRTPISKLRGTWHEYRGVKLMPTLHPAYLLRNPADKRLVWEDIKQVMTELGIGR